MEEKTNTNFIHQQIDEDLATGRNDHVHTRFPPEPNGYLHIGHAKSICLNFGTAEKYGGKCNLRFDDTNPEAEKDEFVETIKEDIRWLGYDWEDRLCHASDYFEQLYQYAVEIVKQGKAFVCDLSAEEVAANRGTPGVPGKESPNRNRSVEENLRLFEAMKNGAFEDGSHTLRAKIDMASPNMHMRDPAMYRIRKKHHHQCGDQWCIYPMYDFAHCLSDAIEGITHSICTLEFEVHRPLYEWYVDRVIKDHKPRQIEFARLNLSYTVMSKRLLSELVEKQLVSGWDDPRMPTISGLRRRGFSPESIRNFCDRIGVAKRNGVIDVALLEHSLREDLNKRALRRMGVLKPLKVIITNYEDDKIEMMEAVNNHEDPGAGTRQIPFSKELFIEYDDFMEDPPGKFFRLGPGREVRLRYAYFVTCNDYDKDPDTGEVSTLYCTYDPLSRGGQSPDGRKVKGTLHWVSAAQHIKATVRLYDRLFTVESPDPDNYLNLLNPDAMKVINDARLELSLKDAEAGNYYQFERLGYFNVDTKDSIPGQTAFNRSVPLRDTWGKINRK